MRSILLSIVIIACWSPLVAQYAPQAGLPGSTAISSSSSQFVKWADRCVVQRGYINIDTPSLGYVSYGDSTMALGIADHSVVSLGDSGVATIQVAGTIYDGPGADFAIFENGFIDPSNDSLAFLELAFVEVSSDGVHYERFPASSLTQTNVQIAGSGDYMYANLIDNLAGKYGVGYGTPFDLSVLPANPDVNTSAITHIRIVDVIGSINKHSSYDTAGHIINDPYPTNFATGGFDLDAVGIINYTPGVGIAQPANNKSVVVYPVPATDKLYIDLADDKNVALQLMDINGKVLQEIMPGSKHNEIDIRSLSEGIYLLRSQDNNGLQCIQKVIKR